MTVAEHLPLAQFIRHDRAPSVATHGYLFRASTVPTGFPAVAGAERPSSLFEKGTR